MAYGKQAATQQYAMLALLGAAAERSMPLEGVFAAFGHERGGWTLAGGRCGSPTCCWRAPAARGPGKGARCVAARSRSAGPRRILHGHALRSHWRAIATCNFFEPVWQTVVPKILYVCIFPRRPSEW